VALGINTNDGRVRRVDETQKVLLLRKFLIMGWHGSAIS